MAWKFLLQGVAVPGDDGRQVLLLNPGERSLVLAEMRGFLEATQKIVAASTQGDTKAAASAARTVGVAAQQAVPGTLIGKLPLAFKKLGFDTHSKFDALALDAEQLGDPQHTLTQLGELMQNCVACHRCYRIDPEESR